jgi:hypothetical protein
MDHCFEPMKLDISAFPFFELYQEYQSSFSVIISKQLSTVFIVKRLDFNFKGVRGEIGQRAKLVSLLRATSFPAFLIPNYHQHHLSTPVKTWIIKPTSADAIPLC